jgi:hypothetical protein
MDFREEKGTFEKWTFINVQKSKSNCLYEKIICDLEDFARCDHRTRLLRKHTKLII